jgi:hypothetical protein
MHGPHAMAEIAWMPDRAPVVDMTHMSAAPDLVAPTNGSLDRTGTFRAAWRLLRLLLKGHKRLFFTAVAGASVFAACTVLSAEIVGRITDDLIRPRFEDGSVGSGTVALVLGALILVGIVRGAGVVVRRVWAGRTGWRRSSPAT